MSSPRRQRRPLTEEERAERRETERKQMQEAVEALRTSEGWQRWLRVRHHFHDYSFANQLLIAMQCPEATRVAGFRRWLELGYAVQKGQRAIRIWAPCPPSKTVIERWRDAGADPEKEPRTRFRLVPVFDASQVAPLPEFPGEPVPLRPPHEPIEGDGLAEHFDPLAAFARNLDLTLSVEEIPGSALGYHEPATGRVVIEALGPEFSANAQVSVLIHELSHALVRKDRREGDPKLDYAAEEVVVESVAFTVCASLGLDTGGSAIPYVTGWFERTEGDPLEAFAELIDRLARRLEDVIFAGAEPGRAEVAVPAAA
jgi:antirestriction protein ArdC